MSGKASEQPGQWPSDINEPTNTAGGDPQLAPLQTEPTLEQNHSHAQGHCRFHGVGHIRPVRHPAGHRADQQTTGRQQDDRRQADPPGQPLGSHTYDQNGDYQQDGAFQGEPP